MSPWLQKLRSLFPDYRKRTGILIKVPVPLLCALALLCLATHARAVEDSSPAPADQVKAAFLFNFIKFTDWPADSGGGGTICVGILGRDPFGDALDTLSGKLAKGRRVVVAHYRRVEEVKDCEVLFVSDSEKGRLSHVLKTLSGSHVLTVAEQEGFCEAGGMINLVSARGKMTFEINMGAATRARLRISSQLLRLARSVL